LEQYLRSYCNKHKNDWALKLPFAEFTYNSSKHQVLQRSPFSVAYGYEPKLPWHPRQSKPEDGLKGGVPAAQQRIETLVKLRQELVRLWDTAQNNRERYYNKHRLDKHFSINEWVLLSTKNLRLRAGKLSPKFIGPFKIIECIGDSVYRLDLPSQYEKLHPVFNVSLLEVYHPRKGHEPWKYPTGEFPDLAEEDEEQE
jgi:hypothetical protein